MKTKFVYTAVFLSVLLLASCVGTNPETGIRYNEYIQEAEEGTHNMIYGYLGGEIVAESRITILPWEYEIVDTIAGTVPFVLSPKLSLGEQWDFDIAYSSWVRDSVFAFENLEPGKYYIGGISKQRVVGRFMYTDTIIFPRPDKSEAITIGKGDMLYWGAFNALAKNPDEAGLNFDLEVADNVTKNEVIVKLLGTIKNDTWTEALAAERN